MTIVKQGGALTTHHKLLKPRTKKKCSMPVKKIHRNQVDHVEEIAFVVLKQPQKKNNRILKKTDYLSSSKNPIYMEDNKKEKNITHTKQKKILAPNGVEKTERVSKRILSKKAS